MLEHLKTLEASRFIFFLTEMMRTDEVISRTACLSFYGFLARGAEGRVRAQGGAVVVSNCLNILQLCKIKYMRIKISSCLALFKLAIFLIFLYLKKIHICNTAVIYCNIAGAPFFPHIAHTCSI